MNGHTNGNISQSVRETVKKTFRFSSQAGTHSQNEIVINHEKMSILLNEIVIQPIVRMRL